MTDRQLKVAVIVGGTILALILAVVVMAACGLFTPHPIPNLQLPTI